LDILRLSWFGGEPLLASDVVLDISEHAALLARENARLVYRGAMTTNGHLLVPETFAALVAAGVCEFQISLDGPREVHNRSRLAANGGPTFDRIWENLLAIKETELSAAITLRIHFDGDTVSQMEPLLDLIRTNFLADPRFSVFFKAIERLGGPDDARIKVLGEEEKAQAVSYLQRQLFGEILPPSDPEELVCYAARPNSLLIRADGRLGKCTVALNDERNVIGKLNPDGTLSLDQRRVLPWLRGLENLDPEVLGCPLVGMPA
jgi:uncharacterized protein